MGQTRTGFLVFEDTTYGSFSASFTAPRAGFRWATDDELEPLPGEIGVGRAPRGPWLVQRDPVDGGPWGRRYSPFRTGRQTTLLGAFRRLTTPVDFLGFANKHGFLGHPTLLVPAAGGSGVLGESLSFWQHHARQARILTTLALWVVKGETEKLGSVVFWAKEPERVVVRPGAVLDRLEADAAGRPYVSIGPEEVGTVGVDANGLHVPDDLSWFWRLGATVIQDSGVLRDASGQRRWRFGDVVGPARFYACEALNKEVNGHVHPKVLPFVDDPELWRLYFVPDCVLAAIYLQLQLVLTKGAVERDSKQCAREGCANTVVPSGNARYCSDPCRRWGRSQSNKRYHRTSPRAAPTARAAGAADAT